MKSYFKVFDRTEMCYIGNIYGEDFEFDTEDEAQEFIDEDCSYMSDFHLSQLEIEEYISERG